MAGLFDKLARQVLNSLEPKKTTQVRPKTMSQVANRQPVVVMPVKPVESATEVEGAIDKEEKTNVAENVIITLEKEMTTENIIVENVPENKSIEKDDYLLAQIDEFRAKNFEMQTGKDMVFEKIEAFEKEYRDFRENPLVNDFLAAELAFCRLIQNNNARIADAIDFE